MYVAFLIEINEQKLFEMEKKSNKKIFFND